MGFASLPISSSFHASIAQNLDKFDIKLQSFKLQESGRNTHFINFKLAIRTRKLQRIGLGMAICCKRTEMIDFEERTSANEVRKEIERCYELIHRLGRGVIYIGSARPDSNHPHYVKALELSRQVASLLDCTTWTGAGPGLMDAAIKGALQAGKPVGGFKIEKEAGQWTSTGFHPYLPPHTYLTCRVRLYTFNPCLALAGAPQEAGDVDVEVDDHYKKIPYNVAKNPRKTKSLSL